MVIGFVVLMLLLHFFFYESYAFALRKYEINRAYKEIAAAYQTDASSLDALFSEIEESCLLHLDIITVQGDALSASQEVLVENIGEDGNRIFCDGCNMELTDILVRAFGDHDSVSAWIQGKGDVPYYYDCENCFGFVTPLTTQENGDAIFVIGHMPNGIMQRNTIINLSFLMAASMVVLLVTVGLGYYWAGKLTRPLIEMSRIANDMSRMKFDMKFQGAKSDEVGELGDALNRMSDILESVLAQLRKSNAELAYEVQDNRRMIGERQRVFLNISHELKTPVAIINGCAEGLLLGVATTSEAQKEYLTAIADESARLNQLIQQLLDVSRIESEAVQVLLQRVALRPICERLSAKLFILNREKNIKINIADTDVLVYTDLDMLEQVLLNYLTNAVRYAYKHSEIVVSAQEMMDGAMRICVFNQGDSIKETDIDKLWDQFYRTDGARSREAGGTGIGLSIVRAVAQRLDDTCGVENRDGGVVFWYEISAQKQRLI